MSYVIKPTYDTAANFVFDTALVEVTSGKIALKDLGGTTFSTANPTAVWSVPFPVGAIVTFADTTTESGSDSKTFEDRVLSAKSRALAREKMLYGLILDRITEDIEALQLTANAIAELDLLGCFAERAESLDFSQPEFTESSGIDIQAGRHAVVEQVQTEASKPGY